MPQRTAGESTRSDANDADLVYANNVVVVAEPGGLRLIFTRTHPREAASDERAAGDEIVFRLVLPPVAARRLLRLLPERLDRQQELAEEYARETERDVGAEARRALPREPDPPASDPFLAALAAAEEDDEPSADEQRAAARAGWEEYLRGETIPWEDVKRELLEEDDASSVATS